MMEWTIQYRANIIASAYKDFLKNGTRVLDVGCGNGIVASKIAEMSGASIKGTDIMGYVKTAVPFTQMPDEETLPFADNSFDVAMINDVLHHMPFDQQGKIIREALRVSPLVLAFELEPTPLTRFLDWLSNKIHNWHMRIPFTFRRSYEWAEYLKKEGHSFEIKKVARPTLYPVSNFVLVIRRS
jgi:ubiquinone/menaquinone biosynthesis C-methylase UbiE